MQRRLFDTLLDLSRPLDQPLQSIPECQLVRIVVAGVPVAKGRGRVGKLANGRACVFTPSHTRKYEDVVRLAASQAMDKRVPITETVEVRVGVFLPVPKSMSKRNQALALQGKLRPATKPDIDNYVKSALDGINTIIIRDDNQVATLRACKFFSDKPRLEIEVLPI